MTSYPTTNAARCYEMAGQAAVSDDVVITGMGIVSPVGVGEHEFWSALCEGRTGAALIDCLDTTELPRKIGCQVRNRDEATKSRSHEGRGWIPTQGDEETPTRLGQAPGRGDQVGRAGRLAIAAARQAVQASRLGDDVARPGAARFDVIVGTTMGETEFIEDRLSAGPNDWLSPEHVRRILRGRPGSIARRVADSFVPVHADADVKVGEMQAVDLYGACAAGNMAIASARRRLLDGQCDVAIAGGADGFSRLAFIGFMRLRVMAAEVCRPFDVDRDGLFVGEGAAMFVLERESSAKARGAPIRARIIGTGNVCENYHPTRPHPEGDGLSRAIMAALVDAGLSAGDIDYICAHGTGTPQNDAIEVTVMNRLFPAGRPFSSIKALTGHTMGAAAAVEAAACVLMLEHQTLIPTWHLANVLQPCLLDALSGGPRSARVRYAINNSAGFGGYNSSVVIAAA